MSKISLFTPAFNKTPSESLEIEVFLTDTRFGKYKKEIEAIRIEPDPDKRKLLKQKLDGVTIAGTFTERKESGFIAPSGFICIDIDGFSDRTNFISDPYTFACYSSASGGGLAIIVKIDSSKFKESFRWLQNYYFQKFGIPVDPAPSSIASLRFVSFDPNLFHNPKSSKSRTTAREQKSISSLPVFYPQDKVGEMVRDCVSRGVNIAESYHEYLTLGFAIAAGFGESGRPYFHALAGVSTKYNSEQCERQYNFCLRNPNGGITVGSFYFLLKQAGITLPDNNIYENAIRVTAVHKKSKMTEEGSIATLTEILHVPQEDAIKIVKEVYSRPDITLSSIAADPEKLIESLMAWMKANHPLKKNIITGKLENSEQEVTKEHLNTIYLRARAAFNTPNITYDLIERVLFSEYTEQYNPIKEYIESNRHRNTTENISRLIESINTTTLHSNIFIRKWLIAIPAAVEGKPIRLVLALTGGQLTGKTEWFRRLLPSKLKKYYGESKLEAGKDDELLMCQKLIVMDDELGGKNASDSKHFKMLSSKDFFSLRAPYDKANMDYKRLALLCGTSNEKEIINDPTGNTRILPVEVISIDHEKYNAIDKDELFMEIVRAYESGEDWNFNKEESEKLSDTSEDFEGIHYERELILRYFVPQDEAAGNGFVEEMSATEIKDHIESQCDQRIFSLNKLGRECTSIFGHRHSIRKGGKKFQVYSVVKIQKPQDQQQRADYLTNLEKYQPQSEVDF